MLFKGQYHEKNHSSTFNGTVSPPEQCDFTSSQQYNNNVL